MIPPRRTASRAGGPWNCGASAAILNATALAAMTCSSGPAPADRGTPPSRASCAARRPPGSLRPRGAAERLVGGGGDDVGVRHRATGAVRRRPVPAKLRHGQPSGRRWNLVGDGRRNSAKYQVPRGTPTSRRGSAWAARSLASLRTSSMSTTMVFGTPRDRRPTVVQPPPRSSAFMPWGQVPSVRGAPKSEGWCRRGVSTACMASRRWPVAPECGCTLAYSAPNSCLQPIDRDGPSTPSTCSQPP